MTQEHTLREKGQALFLSALMVLSVFAMSAAFAGAAAADVTEDGVTADDVNLATDDEATIEVQHTDDTDNALSVVISEDNQYSEDDDILVDEIEGVNGENTTVNVDVSELDESEYNVYAVATDGTLEAPEDEDDLNEWSQASTTFEVIDVDPNAQFDSNSYSQVEGDIAEFTVNLEGTDTADVTVGSEDVNYEVDLTVQDGNDDGEVTVYMNTYSAGQEDPEDVFSTDEGDSIESVNRITGNLENPLATGDYALSVTTEEEAQDVATLTLEERSTGDAAGHTAPVNEDIESIDDVEEYASPSDEVAEEDSFILAVDVTGIEGLINAQSDEFDLHEDGLNEIDVSVDHQNPGVNASETSVDVSDQFYDADSDTYFIVIEDNDLSAAESGDEFDVTFELNGEEFDYLNDEETEQAGDSFTLVDREASLDDVDDEDNLEVPTDGEFTMSGDSTIAPNSEIDIRLDYTSGTAFVSTADTTVDSDGNWEVDIDLSEEDIEDGTEFDIELRSNGQNIANADYTGTFSESAADGDQEPHPVTITVEDADGEPVEDAEVEIDGQTETTDSNGEATFELQHGEYDVTASYDGQEASGTLTVDDDTADSTTIVLGEEDQDLNENAGSDDDEQNQDDNTQDDNNQDDQNNDDNNQDDSSGDANGDDSSGDDPEDEEQPGFGIAVALIALLAAAGIALRNRA